MKSQLTTLPTPCFQKPEGFESEMTFEKGDLVKLDVGVHIKGALADNALTVEVGGGGKHTDQIRAAREARDASIEAMVPGGTWAQVGSCRTGPHRCRIPANH